MGILTRISISFLTRKRNFCILIIVITISITITITITITISICIITICTKNFFNYMGLQLRGWV